MLSITRSTIGYGKKPVLDFPGMELVHGSQCLLIGPSGSGKTTLLYAMAGLAEVLDGRVSLNETEITGLTEAARDRFRGANIGIIFQTLHLVKSLSVINNLLLASYLAGLPQRRERAIALLEKLGIGQKQDQMPATLSQGQAQRVAIARAVLHEPALILADEPTSSLDDSNATAAVDLICEVARETGASLVVATHDARIKPRFQTVIEIGGAS
jgi:ABC-type lipoprotein export system ATPase subunit